METSNRSRSATCAPVCVPCGGVFCLDQWSVKTYHNQHFQSCSSKTPSVAQWQGPLFVSFSALERGRDLSWGGRGGLYNKLPNQKQTFQQMKPDITGIMTKNRMLFTLLLLCYHYHKLCACFEDENGEIWIENLKETRLLLIQVEMSSLSLILFNVNLSECG